MTAPSAAAKSPGVRVKRFFKTPKGILIPLLAVLAVTAAFGSGIRLVAPVLLGAILGAVIVDVPILRYREHQWVVPDGAVLTGMIVAMVLTPMEPWYVAAATGAFAVASKYVLRAGRANVFNPAALALLLSYFVFSTGQSWWGALPELPWWAITLLFATGIFISDRVNKIPLVLSFLGAYYLLVTITAFAGDPAKVAGLYRAPDLHAALFFAFFMVTDPPTSPPKHKDQLVYGAIVAVTSYAVFELVGAVYFLLAGLLVANAWEAWRRHSPG